MGYPKHMYRGSYTDNEIIAEELVVTDEAAESAARADGYTDGHSFFSTRKGPDENEEAPISAEPTEPPPVEPVKPKRKK